MKQLLSFHNDHAVKEKYLTRLRAHRAADEIIQGTGFDGKKGCAVGCTLNNYDHDAYEVELGIPRILARLEDRIFEGLSVEDSKDFPISFLSSIPVGVDLKDVFKKVLIWILVDEADGCIKYAKTEQTRTAIQNVANLIARSLTEKITDDEYKAVREAAWKARNVAYAAAYAAYAAAAADAADAAYAAAAADAADAAAAYAAYAARKVYYKKLADQLVKILSEVKG